jgi:hypothetical protein
MTSSLGERLRAAYGGRLRAPSGEREPDPTPRQGWPEGTLDDALPGAELRTAEGTCWLYRQRYSLERLHGRLPLGAYVGLPGQAFGLLGRAPEARSEAGLDPRELIFLDTETTGLAGGTGTLVFLVGLAYLDGESLVLEQLFMREPAEEPALLAGLAERLASFRHVATFNGKSFDLPLLETRRVLARMGRLWDPEVHLDLLHPARRMWRWRLASCALTSLEQAVLGYERIGDLPSWMIPATYSSYVHGADRNGIRAVFEHNAQDLLSLTVLLARLGAAVADPLGAGLEADELLAVARLYGERGQHGAARELLEAALDRADASLRAQAQHLLAVAARRSGDRERAAELWAELAHGPTALVGLVELAKHHEHHRRDLAAALAVVEQALGILELRESRDGAWAWQAQRLDLERRQARLLRKRGLAS